MRLASAALVLAVLAPGFAHAGVHLHLPKAHPHGQRARNAAAAKAAESAPVSDTPEAVWAGRNGR